MSRVIHLSLALLCAGAALAAQQQQGTATKPTLTTADLSRWETLGSGALSPDGKWVAYDFRRNNTSVELRYRPSDGGTETAVPSATTPQFSNDSIRSFPTPRDAAGAGPAGGDAAETPALEARRLRLETRSSRSICAPDGRRPSTTSNRTRSATTARTSRCGAIPRRAAARPT
jgi:hypothetical protein